MSQKLWWISWNQAADPEHGLDYRPVIWPPPDPVLGFWGTGFAADESYSTVVALVRAATLEKALEVLSSTWNPGMLEWRFGREFDESAPPGSRFPVPQWSIVLGRWPWAQGVVA